MAEGLARVILSEDQLADVQPGEILVAATTSPSWTPVFSFIKGVVVDRGASLSHAAIVGREYGIPVLMNVFVGTEKIRTGQRIRRGRQHGCSLPPRQLALLSSSGPARRQDTRDRQERPT